MYIKLYTCNRNHFELIWMMRTTPSLMVLLTWGKNITVRQSKSRAHRSLALSDAECGWGGRRPLRYSNSVSSLAWFIHLCENWQFWQSFSVWNKSRRRCDESKFDRALPDRTSWAVGASSGDCHVWHHAGWFITYAGVIHGMSAGHRPIAVCP